MKYRIEWLKYKNNNKITSKQHVVVFNPDDVLHIIDNLKKDPQVLSDSVDFYALLGDS